MTRQLQRQLRQQRQQLHMELPASYSTRLMSKFGRNGYEASFGYNAANAAAAAAVSASGMALDGGGGGSGGGGVDDEDDGGGGGRRSGGGRSGGGSGRDCGSRADELRSLYGDGDDDEYEMMLDAVPTPASERANTVLVMVPNARRSDFVVDTYYFINILCDYSGLDMYAHFDFCVLCSVECFSSISIEITASKTPFLVIAVFSCFVFILTNSVNVMCTWKMRSIHTWFFLYTVFLEFCLSVSILYNFISIFGMIV